jgi:alpha-L-rhamnosidase
MGETISGSSNAPSGYYGNPVLYMSGVTPPPSLTHIRISYASLGIELAPNSAEISDVQFVNCLIPIEVGGTVHLQNSLMTGCQTNIEFIANNASLAAENVTFSGSACLSQALGTNAALVLTNCILADITNLASGNVSLSGDTNGFWNSPTFGNMVTNTFYPFQTAGGGNFYLANGCNFLGAGTTYINTNLLAELRQKTTHPPVVLTGGVLASNDIALWPQVQRETNAPDLGFAYDPIDYELGAIVVTNPIQITLTPGTVIAGFGTNGIGRSLTVANGARFLASGTPIQPVRIVEYSTVQEHVPTNWNMPFYSILTDDIYENGSPPPACFNCRFTDFSAVANDGPQLGLTASRSDIRDCQFHGGTFATYATDTVTNCLFERTVTYIQPYSGTGKSVLENNLFFGGQFYFETSSGTNGVVRDNLFDRTTVYFNDVSYQGGYNAFVTNFDRIHPTNATDIILADTGYVPGPLGNYYYPTNGGNLSRLIDAGGTTADAVGLYQFTTVTNFASGVEIKEANSVVDVGFHYVAVDSNGNPIDTDGGGIADYMEDGNGNGLVDAGESDWTAGHGSDDYKNLLTPAYLRCEYRENPWGVDARPSITSTNAQRPRLYWIVKSDRRAERQLAYRVLVASSESNLASDYGDMWDSGKVYSDQTIHVEYNGTTLQSGMRLWWKVRTWDWYTGLPSPWSTNGFFQMGLLSTSDWNGVEWIGVNGYNPAKPSPMYRSQQFLLTNQVKNATVYVSAKGVYELWINGYRIGPNILAPEWTDYNQRIQYQTFDVAPYLTNGTLYSSNVMGAFVGEGWCYGPTDHGSPPFYGAKNPQFALRLNVTNTDGTVTNILTDSTWVCSTNGPIRFSSIYDGETYDATQEGASTNWSLTSYSPTTFTVPMTVSNVAGSQMASQPNEPRQITQLIRPIAMWNTSTNSGRVVTVFDMGQNMVGWCSLSLSNLSGLTGTTITLRHAERLLLDTNNYPIPSGNIDTNNLRDFFGHADQIESYILNGDQNRQFQPHFTYHGFRYVEVTSPLAIATNLSLGSVTGCVIHSAVPFTGGFCCYGTNSNSSINWVLQNGLINKLVTNGIWGIRGNLQGVFTACTQRAEREGYLYDEDIISQTACFDVDMSAFLTKWIRDIRDAQSYRHSSFGDWSYTDFAPWDNLLSVSYYDPCAQGSALIFPWRMFQNYGDTRALAEHYTSTTNYIGFLTNFCHAGSGSWDTTVWTEGGSVMVGDWATGDFFDWQSSGGAHPFKWPCGTNTPSPYHHALVYSPCWGTAWSAASLDFAARCSDVLKQVALSQGDTVSALHYSGDFQNFTNLAATARSAYTNSANGIVKFSSSIITNIGWNSQSDHVTALNLNMIPDGNRQDVLQLLLNTTYGISDYARDYPYGISTNHLSGGYFGAPKAMLELTRAGYTKKAYELLVDTNFPCWLHPVVNGHTTFWEGWNAYLPGPRTLGATYNDRGYYPQPLQSFNHLAFGAVGEWIWKVIGGINPDDSNPGFRNAIIKPEPGAGITNAFASFRSIRGPIITSWTNNPAVSNYILNVTVPANATASICLPSTNLTSITESGTWATNSPGVFSYYPTNWPGWTGGATVFSVGSGSYSFAITNISF